MQFLKGMCRNGELQAEGTGTPTGFGRQLSANSAENPLAIPTGIPCVIFLDLTKSCSSKTAQHPTACNFALDFCTDDESLLTQAEEDKEKYKQKDCCGAVCVLVPSA